MFPLWWRPSLAVDRRERLGQRVNAAVRDCNCRFDGLGTSRVGSQGSDLRPRLKSDVGDAFVFRTAQLFPPTRGGREGSANNRSTAGSRRMLAWRRPRVRQLREVGMAGSVCLSREEIACIRACTAGNLFRPIQ
jgi:hypothetical protein